MAIGLNYKDHAAEMKKALPAEPLLFIKPPTSVIGPGGRHPDSGLGRTHRARGRDGGGHRPPRLAGEGRATPWTTCSASPACATSPPASCRPRTCSTPRAKGFDTFAPIGPCIAVGLDPSELEVEGWVNGEKRQHSNTRELIFPVPEVVEWLTRFCTLEPGDVITTGTPSGVGPLVPGDRMMVKVQGVGALSNPCVEA